MSTSLRLILPCIALVLFALAADLVASVVGPPDPATATTPALVDAEREPFAAQPEALLSVGTGFGVLLLGAWLLGKFAAQLGLSKITGFLVFGILVGPYTLEVISLEQMEYLKLVNGLAIALIALTAGSEIHVPFIKKFGKAITYISVIEMGIVMVLITVLMEFMLHADDSPVVRFGGEGAAFWVALSIGTIAAANSPAVVIAIITETGARGVMAQTGLAVTVVKDLLTIIAFAVVLALAGAGIQRAAEQREGYIEAHPEYAETHPEEMALMESPETSDAAGTEGAKADASGEKKESIGVYLLKHVPGSMGAGVLVAGLMAFAALKVGAALPIVLIAASFAITLLSTALGLEPLIVGLTAGFLMSNFFGARLAHFFETVEELSMPVYAVFFSLAGCKVDPSVVQAVWHYVLALVVLRAIGTAAGCWIGGKLGRVERPARDWVWASLIPQAGIALALTQKIATEFAHWPFMEKVYAIMLSAVAVHELIGPLIFKFALGRAGEINPDADTKGGAGAH
ncbi:MAG: cation:proton antiporter [Planctomycetota bacterium]